MSGNLQVPWWKSITLWDSEMLQKDINVSPQPNTDFKIIASDSSEAKSEALNVSASLEASFLGGLVSVKGSAEFLHDKKTSKHQSRVSLQYRTTTHFEQLTMDHLGAGNVKHCNVFREGSATHVVTAILYGAQAFFVFDREVSSGENHQDIQGNLQATIKKIPLITIEGKASLKMSEEEKQQANTFSCTFHGDFALENNPVTFEDATRLYAGLPRLLGEKGEHAVPMTVWLYPLKNLDSAAAQLVRQISVSLVCRAQRILDGLDNTDVLFRDLMMEGMAIKFPEIKAKLSKFRDLCSEYKLVFQKGLCKVLPNIRGGGMEEEELIKMLNSVPTIKSLEHDCVHVQINPPHLGVKSVESYQAVQAESEWTEIKADTTTNQVTIRRLNPYKDYRFSCRALCRPGVSLSSDWTEYSRTRPCSPPGPPTEKNLEYESIRVNWDIPTMVGDDVEVIGYETDYRECAKSVDNKMWHTIKTTTRECTLEGLKPETAYSVRVSANCGEAGKSLPSPEAVLTTIRASDAQPKRSQSTGARSEEFLKKSEKVKKGNPSIYRLNLEQKLDVMERFEQYTFGGKVEKGNNKVILLLGSTGAGKTTLVNVMINYILGVKWEDHYRFKLIHEVTNRSQAESQTSIVTSNELYNQPGFQIPYSLTIIDTPGFGDTRGMAHDKLITQQVKEFLCNPLEIDHIDAVCFVVQESLARLSANQKYIFDSILSIFGKDIADNILMLVTFADGKDVPVLEAIQAADLPCKKNKKGLPTHFKFNNSVLLSQKDDNEEGLEKIVWRSTFKQMKAFFKALESNESKDLTMTKKVLEERERLEKAMTRLTPQITAGLSKLNEIKTFEQCLQNEDENMKQNQDFETEVEVLVAKRTKLSCFATNCIVCKFTCHTSCFLPNEDDIKKCAVMDGYGNCVMCPGNCSYLNHDKEKALWTYETKTEKKTIKELKDNFMKAQGKFMNNKQMLEKIEDEYIVIEDKLKYLIKLSSNYIKRLNEIVLKPSSLSTVEYIEILIRTEEDQRKPGFEDRIVGLKKMKYESELLEKMARGEELLPDERRKVKEKQDRLQKITKRLNQMQKVVRDWPGKK
ncbi:unnamed protein product [Oncorhynchus mykiss]|uniref:Fibronectin type-III domain-containing protein n=1 Tax=Oncorhynchus mykiss TaxID=8022 RepID=A0A060XS91_ONCMY|nr:unnamed protein product [Oncorhynchus mykiss]